MKIKYKTKTLKSNTQGDLAICNIVGTGLNFGDETEEEAIETAKIWVDKYYIKKVTYQVDQDKVVIRKNHRNYSYEKTIFKLKKFNKI